VWRVKVWTCEFCEERNVVDILPEEIPNLADVTYMLRPAPATTAASCGGVDESIVVFCVDISGSMCVSKEVQTLSWLLGHIGSPDVHFDMTKVLELLDQMSVRGFEAASLQLLWSI